jgi:hypothetical protein
VTFPDTIFAILNKGPFRPHHCPRISQPYQSHVPAPIIVPLIPEDPIRLPIACPPVRIPCGPILRSASIRPLLDHAKECCEPTSSQPQSRSAPNQHHSFICGIVTQPWGPHQSDHELSRRTAPRLAYVRGQFSCHLNFDTTTLAFLLDMPGIHTSFWLPDCGFL